MTHRLEVQAAEIKLCLYPGEILQYKLLADGLINFAVRERQLLQLLPFQLLLKFVE